MLHINARSLNTSFDSIQLLLSSLNNYPFSAIGVTETWLHSKSPPIFNIDNYRLLRSDREHGRGGGVAIYAHNQLRIKIRPDIHISGCENLFIEILNEKSKNIILGTIYRPPNTNSDLFLESFDQCLNMICKENKNVYLMGDYNINLLSTENNHTLTLINLLYSLAFHPHINNPTRISCNSESLLDNVFSNVSDENFNGVLYYDISDHLPIFVICKQSKIIRNTQKYKTKLIRNETRNNIDSLNFDLAQEEWLDVLNQFDANNAYETFINKLLFYYNKNIPLTSNKSRKRINNPWITKGILRSIKTRNRLYKTALKSQNNEKLSKYKQYRNRLTSIIRLSRKLYYSRKLENSKNNVNSLWNCVNDLVGEKIHILIIIIIIYSANKIRNTK